MKLFFNNTEDPNKSVMLELNDIREFFNNRSGFVVIFNTGKIETFHKLEYTFTLYNRDFFDMP